VEQLSVMFVCFMQVLQSGEEPLSLESFLSQERTLDVTDAQHIANKLLYDATNEALTNVYKMANRVKVCVLESKRAVPNGEAHIPKQDVAAQQAA